MRASELMVYDLIKITKGNLIGRVYDINQSRDFVGYCNIDAEEIYLDASYMKYVEPIPLTEEILKANGFEYEKRPENCMVFEKETDDIDIIIAHYQDTPNKFFTNIEANETEIRKDILTVHELQHALRICGLNELANNFKV